jgi:hypothetical protein
VNREAGERMNYPIVDWKEQAFKQGKFWWK